MTLHRVEFDCASGHYDGPARVLPNEHDWSSPRVQLPNGHKILICDNEIHEEIPESAWRVAQEVCTPVGCRAVSLIGDLGRGHRLRGIGQPRKRSRLKQVGRKSGDRSKATEPDQADSGFVYGAGI